MLSSVFLSVRIVFFALACMSVVFAAPIPIRRYETPPFPSSGSVGLLTLVSRIFLKHTTTPPPMLQRKEADSGGLDFLFPISGAIAEWTTLDGAPGSMALSDKTLRPHNVASETPYTYVTSHGKKAIKAHYPEGSYKPSASDGSPKGGLSFYAPGPASVDLTTAKEATFGYAIMFPAGFKFVKGGKLPGIYGGNSDKEALGCSGGRRSTACFSARLMWRAEGDGELYTYLPTGFKANEDFCKLDGSHCDAKYGASVGRGSFKFATGEWTTVSQRVKLNEEGKSDGELDLFVGGKRVVSLRGLVLRDGNNGKMRGIQMQTFFGGSSPEWKTPEDQDVFFADLSVAIISKL